MIMQNLRLLDLLLVLLFDGRDALPAHTAGSFHASDRGRGGGRAIIELIRAKDTDALIDEIEIGRDPNWTDEVGQTLLNWASAFGTAEQMRQHCVSPNAVEEAGKTRIIMGRTA